MFITSSLMFWYLDTYVIIDVIYNMWWSKGDFDDRIERSRVYEADDQFFDNVNRRRRLISADNVTFEPQQIQFVAQCRKVAPSRERPAVPSRRRDGKQTEPK